MDQTQQSAPGFSDHVQDQLRQAAMAVPATQPTRGRGQNRRGRTQYQPFQETYQPAPRGRFVNGPDHHRSANQQPWDHQVRNNATDLNSFPPLGAARPQPQLPIQQQFQNGHYQQQQPQSNIQHHNTIANHHHPVRSQPPNNSYNQQNFRGHRGSYRGRGTHNYANNQFQPQFQGQPRAQASNDFQRPAPMQRNLFSPNTHPHFNNMEEQRAMQQKVMAQSDFLNHLANQALTKQIKVEEKQEKENFRKDLEIIAQKVVGEACASQEGFDVSQVQLKLYGSLGSGFGVAGSDMDLLLAFPEVKESLGDVEIESRRRLEKALLDAGIGARLLTNTRVPILRVCQKPNPELLRNLRDYRSRWEQSLEKNEPPSVDVGFGPLPILTETEAAIAETALAKLDLDAHDVPLPASPVPEHAKLEYVGDCGIQCDINFSNYVALHNTRLLKTYGTCDSRVQQVGVFVKMWAKARDINTPYRGTLSSYGYILMVLHYLMNVAHPPVIPNLQELAKQKDLMEGKSDVELVEGFDVRFVQNKSDVQSILQVMPRNHESVGSLLRGFFRYYADSRGFHWNQDVVSIRTQGGPLNKRAKGWTEAKWAGDHQHVRLRYLLAIEDPFEIEHNVARTVGHSGIVAIRDEFRRAWTAIENIKSDDATREWYWLTQDGQKVSGDEMMSVSENRGDLLRKDQDFHRQKARQLRQTLEAKEKALREAAIKGSDDQEDEVNEQDESPEV